MVTVVPEVACQSAAIASSAVFRLAAAKTVISSAAAAIGPASANDSASVAASVARRVILITGPLRTTLCFDKLIMWISAGMQALFWYAA